MTVANRNPDRHETQDPVTGMETIRSRPTNDAQCTAARRVLQTHAARIGATPAELAQVLNMLGLVDETPTVVAEDPHPAPPVVATGCGTIAGWVQHHAAGTPPCGPCLQARGRAPRRGNFQSARARGAGIDAETVRLACAGHEEMARTLTDDERLAAVVRLMRRGDNAAAIGRRLRMHHGTARQLIAAVAAPRVGAGQAA